MLPGRTREAMLEGIASNQIIVGAYTDRGGGVCPMLAAHRNGGRTDFASFARAWDAFTHARRPRRATRREIGALRTYLEMSLLTDEPGGESLAQIADGIRYERRASGERAAAAGQTAAASRSRDSFRVRDLRPRVDLLEATLAAAAEQPAEPTASRQPHPAA